MKVFQQTQADVVLGYTNVQTKLGLHLIQENVKHEKAFGRVAVSCPRNQVRNSKF